MLLSIYLPYIYLNIIYRVYHLPQCFLKEMSFRYLFIRFSQQYRSGEFLSTYRYIKLKLFSTFFF